jgi:hypothetical protein
VLQKNVTDAFPAGRADNQVVDVNKFGPEPVGNAFADRGLATTAITHESSVHVREFIDKSGVRQ